MKKRGAGFGLLLDPLVLLLVIDATACTRVLYETGDETFIVGRTMDWYDDTGTDQWAFPRGMERDGRVAPGSIKWTSKHGSVVGDIHDIATPAEPFKFISH